MRSELAYFLMLADAVIITDANHHIVGMNARFEEVTGFNLHDMIGLPARVLQSGLTPTKTYREMKDQLAGARPWSGVFINRKRNMELWYSNITITPVAFDGVIFYIGVFRDLGQISEGMYVPEARKSRLRGEMFKVLALSCEIRDPGIEEHLVRVQQLTEKLLRAFQRAGEAHARLSDDYIKQVVNASILHDIGKSGIPEGILYKPGRLSLYERKIIEMHPLIGVEILNKVSGELNDELFEQELLIAKSIVEYHHEKWDGSGYPHQLRGNEISFEAQVISIVDVYDALTSRRAYKDAWSKEQAMAYIAEQKGLSFNPDVVDVFLAMISHDNRA